MFEETKPGSDVESLVAACIRNFEDGGDPQIDSVCAHSPQLRESVARRFQILSAMGLVERERLGEAPETLGEFRLLRLLGGGGMGVVYLAEQMTLGRQVALKLIRPENLYFQFDLARDRFLREVQAVARLNHPGIASVYTFGEENGVPYFAMEYIEGDTLEAVVKRLRGRRPQDLSARDLIPTPAADDEEGGDPARSSRFGASWTHTCFRIALQVADALAHAHDNGVVHRDIKPSNIMLTRECRTRLVDFGLAVATGSQRITRSGLTVGSPYYMAPEVIKNGAEAADERTDVYALGVALYELLTLRLPYSGETQQQLLMNISAGEPPSVRRFNPSVPWDAETVCLKAMDVDPARRYQSAAALARDLKNVLELRPIDAVRPGVWLRGWRLAQRRPGLAASLVAVVLIAIALPLGYAILLRGSNRRLMEEQQRTEQQRRRAEENLDATLRSIDLMLAAINDRDLSEIPGIDGPRRRVFEAVRAILEDVAGSEGDRPQVGHRIVRVAAETAALSATLGDIPDAERRSRQTIAAVGRLMAGGPVDREMREFFHNERVRHAKYLADLGRLADARAELAEPLVALGQLVTENPADVALREAYASALAIDGEIRFDTGEEGGQIERAGEQCEQLEHALRLRPADAGIAMNAAQALSGYAWMLAFSRRGDEAASVTSRVREILADCGDIESRPSLVRTRIAVRSNLSEVLRDRDPAQAVAELEQALGDARQVASRFPERLGYQEMLARLLVQLAESRPNLSTDPVMVARADQQALTEFVEAIALYRSLTGRHFETWLELGNALGSYGDLLQRLERIEDAERAYRDALAAYDNTRGLKVDQAVRRDNMAATMTELSRVRGLRGDYGQALDYGNRAYELLAGSKGDASASNLDSVAVNRGVVAMNLLDERRLDEALAALRQVDFTEREYPARRLHFLVRVISRAIGLADAADAATHERRRAFTALGLDIVRHLLRRGVARQEFDFDEQLAALRDTGQWSTLQEY